MDKIKTREKIILAIVGLAILYAGYVYLIEPANKAKTNEQKQEISAPASTVKIDLVKDAETGTDKYIIARAGTNWKKNPFLDRNASSYKEWASIQRAASGSGSAAKMIYSGYIDSGKMKIAIIDGFGYQAGEALEMEGYVLKQVTSSQVVILNKNTGIEVEVPIQE